MEERGKEEWEEINKQKEKEKNRRRKEVITSR